MRVRMRHHITGYRNGRPWPKIGDTIDLPDGEARDLIASRIAEPAGPDPTATVDVDLDGLDKAQLLELAAEHQIEVSDRWGDKRLRATIADELTAAGTDPGASSEENTDGDTTDTTAPADDEAAGSDGGQAGTDDDASPASSPTTAAVDADLDALDKSELIERAGELGVDVDARWGEKRIRATILERLAAAGQD